MFVGVPSPPTFYKRSGPEESLTFIEHLLCVGWVPSALCAVTRWILTVALRSRHKGDPALGMRKLRHRKVKSLANSSRESKTELGSGPALMFLPFPRPQATLGTRNDCYCFYFILCMVLGERLEQLGNPWWLWAELLLPKAAQLDWYKTILSEGTEEPQLKNWIMKVKEWKG